MATRLKSLNLINYSVDSVKKLARISGLPTRSVFLIKKKIATKENILIAPQSARNAKFDKNINIESHKLLQFVVV